MSDVKAVVVDNGSGSCKAGVAEHKDPSIVFPSCVGKRGDREYVGSDAQKRRGILALQYPIQRGHPVLMTDVALNPKANREKMAEIMFETFNIPALYVAIQGALALYSYGRLTGLALDCGDGLSQAVPVIDGYHVWDAVQRLEVGGRDLTDYLVRILTERGHYFNTQSERDVVREAKERLCYVELDYDRAMANPTPALDRDYELPDRQVFTVGADQRFRCPEVLFQPSLMGLASGARRGLLANVLSGGNTLYRGFARRLRRELMGLVGDASVGRMVRRPERQYSVWFDGSIVASQPEFLRNYISREQYAEFGPSAVHRTDH
ncbi:unnamed protein product [Oppiella nova]|uniref:Uncharacterized protein n=1 Tax=Oppiella nova TaxID=334625 RepID=A0A7R9LHZ8_9ACAR|nr:unnamed protein product [Oppiella nova]CAG2163846.1 unnamed protein product [Oppiella nova]